jgi:hypothetical protein
MSYCKYNIEANLFMATKGDINSNLINGEIKEVTNKEDISREDISREDTNSNKEAINSKVNTNTKDKGIMDIMGIIINSNKEGGEMIIEII